MRPNSRQPDPPGSACFPSGVSVATGRLTRALVRMNQSRETATNSSAILEMLAIFYEAFAERDAERRERMLARCLTPDAAIWGHSQVFAGYAAIS